jgi:uncharacterized OB-fold protein
MSDGVPVQACTRCGARYFPHRLVCPQCGARDFEIVTVADGVLEEATVVRRAPGRTLDTPVAIATVLLVDGPRVIARVVGDVSPSARVPVGMESGAPVAR